MERTCGFAVGTLADQRAGPARSVPMFRGLPKSCADARPLAGLVFDPHQQNVVGPSAPELKSLCEFHTGIRATRHGGQEQPRARFLKDTRFRVPFGDAIEQTRDEGGMTLALGDRDVEDSRRREKADTLQECGAGPVRKSDRQRLLWTKGGSTRERGRQSISCGRRAWRGDVLTTRAPSAR